jgi:hypothetical protein
MLKLIYFCTVCRKKAVLPVFDPDEKPKCENCGSPHIHWARTDGKCNLDFTPELRAEAQAAGGDGTACLKIVQRELSYLDLLGDFKITGWSASEEKEEPIEGDDKNV